MAGLDSTLGYEGERPLGLKHAYADIAGALHAVFAIVSALYRRRRTGRGQYIDLSMLKATAATLGAGLMEYEAAGRVLGPMGNYDPTMAPYGNYPCQGDDRWVSIAVASDDEWRGLVEAMGLPAWASEERFASRYQRHQNRRELDALIAEWTSARDAWEITGASPVPRRSRHAGDGRRGTPVRPPQPGAGFVPGNRASGPGRGANLQPDVEPGQDPPVHPQPRPNPGPAQPPNPV